MRCCILLVIDLPSLKQSLKMTKLNFFVLLAVISGLTYISAYQASIGKAEKDQELLWVELKQTPFQPERKNITHEFVFDGSDRNVNRITFITFDHEMVRFTLFSV